MALTKAIAEVDAWTSVAQNTMAEGSTVDSSALYEVTLHIDAALTSTTATTNGIKCIIQISSNTSGDADWTELTSFTMLAGLTATKASVANTLTAGQASVVSVNALTGFTVEGVLQYVKDGASSEMILVKGQSATGVSLVDNVVYGHASTTDVYANNSGAAATILVNIPDTANRIRVVYDNTQDATGSTFDVRCRISKITAV